MNIRSALSVPAAKHAAFLLLTASFPFTQDSTTAKPVPTAQQVMDHYVTALGGRDHILQHKSMTVHGKFELPEKGLSLDRTAYYKDGKMLYEITLPNSSRYQEGFDGTVAWQLHPQSGAAISEGKEVKSKQRDADMYYPTRVLDYFSSMDVVGVSDFEGHNCYHLKGTNKWGIVNEQFYDTSTGLLAGYEFNSAWRGGRRDRSVLGLQRLRRVADTHPRRAQECRRHAGANHNLGDLRRRLRFRIRDARRSQSLAREEKRQLDHCATAQLSTTILSFSTATRLGIPCPTGILGHKLWCQHFSSERTVRYTPKCDQNR